jgi:hypothetical protein
MKRTHKVLIAAGLVLALLLVGTAIIIRIQSGPSGSSDNSKTPLGGLFTRAIAVSDLKQQIGDLRSFHPALMQFARAHEDDLPKTLAELRSCLPKQLRYLDDEHWELPTPGKLTALMNAKDANTTIFLQQKNVTPGKARIVVYADGHIEYRK